MSAKKGKMGSGGMRKTKRVENQPKEDPLKNVLILELIFGYMGVKDLKVVRQVCPLWRDCARKKWNKSVKLQIEKVLEQHSSLKGKRKVEKHRQFLKLVGGKQVPPLGTEIHENWTTLCAQIKTLELGFIILPTVESLRNTLFVCFPNLEHLILGTVKIRNGGHLSYKPTVTVQQALDIRREDRQQNLKSLKVTQASSLPISWLKVLARFPCLETIDVATCGMCDLIFQAVNQIREQDPSKLNLKHILVEADPTGGSIAPAALATLKDRRLQLETLGIKCILGKDVVPSFLDVLQIHAGTLKKLEFFHFPDVQVPFPQDPVFPELKNLQQLNLHLYHSVESIVLLKFAPNLRKLVLYFTESGRMRLASFAHFPLMLSACKELELKNSIQTISIKNMKTLVKWIPNLEVLKIGKMDNAKFALICEHWSNLVELHVGWSRVVTSGITGWDEEDVRRLDSMRRPKHAAVPPWRPITVPRANITCLKNLQIFTMLGGAYQNILLTRAAGIYGIEMLPDLRRLRFTHYKINPKDRNYWKEQHEQYPCPE